MEEGRRVGLDEGRREGVDEGRRSGFDEGVREGREREREAARSRMETLIAAIERGRVPEGGSADEPEGALAAALARGWAPREAEREVALREAVERVGAFLDIRVRTPLVGAGPDTDAEELHERIDRALGALQDLDFFIAEVEEARQGTDLAKMAQDVSREFAADQGIGVRVMLGSPMVRANVNAPALMDTLYLLLHNAGRFGGGSTIDLSVDDEAGRAVVRVRDRGEGFSEDAFARAFDPFYSTSPEGLGLGLPHARKVIEGMGGHIELRNVPDGGAEVEVSFPAA
jgi:signal transduction histidine kinase